MISGKTQIKMFGIQAKLHCDAKQYLDVVMWKIIFFKTFLAIQRYMLLFKTS